jgi:para-aminobenzoate synthetase component II
MFLMIDNYDSFVYNLVRYLKELNQEVLVVRNDDIHMDSIKNMRPQGIILSPGPKTPLEAGITLEVIEQAKGKIPILGICLGHQAIGHAFGARIIKGKEPVHGKISEVVHDNLGVFQKLKNPMQVTRYHSLIVERETLPDCLQISCETRDGVIMGLRHKDYRMESVQFHPEAEMTECGHGLLQNFVEICM